MLRRWRFSPFFLAWLALITTLSLVSLDDQKNMGPWAKIPHFDKLVHFAFYFGGFFAFLSSRELWPAATVKKAVPVVAATAVAYGLLVELLQSFLPYQRTGDLYDVIANSLGAIMAGLLIAGRHLRFDRPK